MVSGSSSAPDTFDMLETSQRVDAAVASAPQGLVVSIPDVSAPGPSIHCVVESCIPVVSMHSGSDVYEQLGMRANLGQTEFGAGLGCSKRMAASGVEKAICVDQKAGNVALDLRYDGFEQGLGAEVEVVSVEMDPTEIEAAVEARLARKPDLQRILTLGPSAGEPALAALRGGRARRQDRARHLRSSADLSPSVPTLVRDCEKESAIDQQQDLRGCLSVVFLALNTR